MGSAPAGLAGPVKARNSQLSFACTSSDLAIALSLRSTLRALTSLDKESRPLLLSDDRIWSFPLFLPLAITAFRGPEGRFSLAILAFGAFEFIVPKYYYCLGKMDKRSLDSLIEGG